MKRRAHIRSVVGAVLLLGACTTSSSSSSSSPGPSGSCPPGIIRGAPSVDMGRGSSEFIPVSDGDTWTAANGPQGGSHLWISIRSTGLGPSVRLEYLWEELDGGLLATTSGTATLCQGSAPTSQQRAGLTAFLPDDDQLRDRLLCQGAFDLRVRVSDEGHSAEARRRVGAVEADPDTFIPFRLRCDAGVGDAGF